MAVQLPADGDEVLAHLGVSSATVTRVGELVTLVFSRDGRDHLVLTYPVGDPVLDVELGRLTLGPPPPPQPRRKARSR